MSTTDLTQPPPNNNNNTSSDRPIKEEELDASIDENIITNPPPQPNDSMNVDSQDNLEAQIPASNLEPRIPAKKDATLREFLGRMDEFAPIIPDAVTNYYLSLSGLPPPPLTSPHLSRLLALATQKFIADIAADAYQYSRIRSSNTSANPLGGGQVVGAAAAAAVAGGGQQAQGKEGAKGAALGVQRPGFGGGGGQQGGRTVLTIEDLGMAVGEYGVNVKRSEFYR